MTSSSKTNEHTDELITLETHDENKLLILRVSEPNPYTGDPSFRVEIGSATVKASGFFQISPPQFTAFVNAFHEDNCGEIHDENGDGQIRFEAIDKIGHFKVSVQIGGPWADQAQISFETDQTAVTPLINNLRRVILG